MNVEVPGLHCGAGVRAVTAVLWLALTSSGALALQCGSGGADFGSWLEGFKQMAAGQGISPAALSTALSGITYDPTVIRLDRSQRSFQLSFEQFYARRVSSSLLSNGKRKMQIHRQTLDAIERRFGVPAPVLVAIWGLETNYGADSGRMSILRSLATLAYDCRRSQFFQNELISALRIVQRGDIPASRMRGGWAGEIGPMQFLASSYVKHAVDFDGDGRRDLIGSVPDMLASTANFLRSHGWRPGQEWSPGSANYAALQQWNKAQVYVRTIGVMAVRLAGSG